MFYRNAERKYDDYIIFVHQSTYIKVLLRSFIADPYVILEKSNMLHSNNKHVPFRDVVGSLIFTAIASRPDIMCAVCIVASYLNNYEPDMRLSAFLSM